MPTLLCHHCGTPLSLDEPIPRESTCESCGRDLRSCKQCRHYDTAYNNSCRETMADPVEDKDRRNFCEYFSFSREAFRPASPQKDREAQARAKLEGLFKQPPGSPVPRAATAREKLDALFKKPKPEE